MVQRELKEKHAGLRLPSAYQEVEYIESSGTQYLNLGFTPPSNYLKTEIKVYPTTTGDRRAGGIYDGSNRANVHYIGMNGYIWGGFGGADYSTGVSQVANTLYEIIMEANDGNYSINLNGTTYTGTYSGTVQVSTARPYYLFGNQENGRMGEPFYGRIYYFKATTSAGLIRDMVPCYRKSDSVIGMYDLVNKVFYTNQGTGTFTKGSNVNTPAKISWVYVGNGDTTYKQIRPTIRSCEFSYDFRNGSLAGFQAVGGVDIINKGGYGIDSGGIYISGSGYDNWFAPYACLPNLSNAKCLTIDSCAYYVAGSWSNNKRVMVTQNGNFYNLGAYYAGQLAFNTSSPSTYNHYGIYSHEREYAYEAINGGTGEYKSTLSFDLVNGCMCFCTCGPTNKFFSTTLTSAEVACIKTLQYATWEKEEGYCYRSERLRCVSYCVNY